MFSVEQPFPYKVWRLNEIITESTILLRRTLTPQQLANTGISDSLIPSIKKIRFGFRYRCGTMAGIEDTPSDADQLRTGGR